MLIKDLKSGADIELVATIVEIQPVRKTWMCLDCKNKGINERDKSYGLWNTEEESRDNCPTCGAKETTEKGMGL